MCDMHDEVKRAVDTFVHLLPDYPPQTVGNPNDCNRWLKVCVLAAYYNTPIDYDYLCETLKEKFSGFVPEAVDPLMADCRKEENKAHLMLDYLVRKEFLKLPADLNF